MVTTISGRRFRKYGLGSNSVDKCIMTLPAQPEAKKDGASATKSLVNEGIIFIEVDNPEDHQFTEPTWIFLKDWKCGTCKNLRREGKEGAKISGIRVVQNEDCRFKLHMHEYADTMLSLIEYHRGFLSETTELDDS